MPDDRPAMPAMAMAQRMLASIATEFGLTAP
jgi:hypothetical protein